MRPFSELYPNLYHVTYDLNHSVTQVIGNTFYNLSFRQTLVGMKLIESNDLIAKISNYKLQDERDTISWNLHRTGVFSACSMYLFSYESKYIILEVETAF